MPASVWPRWLLALIFTSVIGVSAAPAAAPATTPALAYRWNAREWLTRYNPQQFEAAPLVNEDGSEGARIVVSQRSGQNPYNHIIVTNAGLKGGRQYTAFLTCTVIEPTKFPGTFYLYARNSAGNQHDIWLNWIGLPGQKRIIAMPLNLKQIDGGKWTLAVGINKSGGLAVHSIVVHEGETSDGKTPFRLLPVSASTPPATRPVQAATGFKEFSIAAPAEPKKQLAAADFGLTADAPGASPDVAAANAAALQRAFAAARAAGPATLTFAPGIYRISSSAALILESAADLRINGQGARLIFDKRSKEGTAIWMRSCRRVVIENLTFDWDCERSPIASLGVVSKLSSDRLQAEITLPDISAEQTALVAKAPWMSMFGMDPETLHRNELNIFHLTKETSIEIEAGRNVVRLKFPKAAPLVEGRTYCIRHAYYDTNAFKVGDSNDVTFRKVVIHAMPGMGWFFSGGMSNFELLDCHIRRVAGSRQPLTTAADGIHANQFVSNLRIENCSITGTGDDAMNLHNEAYQGDIVTNAAEPTRITLLNCPSYYLRLQKGDPVEFYNADYTPLDGQTPAVRTVAETTSDNAAKPPRTMVEFTEPLPPGLTRQSILINGRFKTGNVLVRNCRMEYTNGRGILLSAHGATLEDNVFHKVYASAINLESDVLPPLWSQGRGASDVLIRRNRIEDCNDQVRYNGALIYTNVRMPFGPTQARLYDRITIENNRFLGTPGPAMWISNAGDLIIRGNEITSRLIDAPAQYNATFMLHNTAHASVEGNTWIRPLHSAPVGGVFYDPASTSDLAITGNK